MQLKLIVDLLVKGLICCVCLCTHACVCTYMCICSTYIMVPSAVWNIHEGNNQLVPEGEALVSN